MYEKRTSPNKKINVDKLKDDTLTQMYRSSLDENILPLLDNFEDKPIDDIWTTIRDNIKNAAEMTIGYDNLTRRNDWFDEDCQEVLDIKNEAYRQFVQRPTRIKKQQYDGEEQTKY